MQLLYIDESGSDELAGASEYFVLGGAAAFEKVPYYACSDIDDIQREFFPGASANVEFRASAIWNGNGAPWIQCRGPTGESY